jgi:hypothetical protein
MLARLFGLFGMILGAAYFNEGVQYAGLLRLALMQGLREVFISWVLFAAWDFLFGSSLIVAGIGLLLLREWARVMWLGLIPALILVHLGIIVVGEVFRGGVTTNYLAWTAMVVTVGVLSWWYLTKERIRAHFSRRKNEPDAAEK